MKTRLLILLLIVVSSCMQRNLNEHVDFNYDEVFMREYPMKRLGNAIEFHLVNDSSDVQNVKYFIRWDVNAIRSIERRINHNIRVFDKAENGNLTVSEYKKTYYSNGNFVNNRKFNDSFYKMLADNFIKMSNRERLKLLDELYNKTNKTNKTKL